MTMIDGLNKAIDGGNRRGPSPPDESGGCGCTPPDGRRRVAGAEAAGSFREVMAIEVVRVGADHRGMRRAPQARRARQLPAGGEQIWRGGWAIEVFGEVRRISEAARHSEPRRWREAPTGSRSSPAPRLRGADLERWLGHRGVRWWGDHGGMRRAPPPASGHLPKRAWGGVRVFGGPRRWVCGGFVEGRRFRLIDSQRGDR